MKASLDRTNGELEDVARNETYRYREIDHRLYRSREKGQLEGDEAVCLTGCETERQH